MLAVSPCPLAIVQAHRVDIHLESEQLVDQRLGVGELGRDL
jgi:hypothetical protein